MTIRKSHGVIHLPTGSRGVAQWQTTSGTGANGKKVIWRVWFNKADWKGDPELVHPDRLVKIDVPEEELEEE